MALRVGLTGSTGAGKSTAAAILAEWGAAVVDADALGHALLAPGSPVYRQVVERYGREVLGPDGDVDREALGRRVFSGPEETDAYNRLIHPALLAELRARLQSEARRAEVVVVDAALLLEWGLERELDVTLVVVAPEETRRERIGARDGPRAATFARRQAAQWSQERKCAAADVVIENSGNLSNLRESLQLFWRSIRGTGKNNNRV